MKADVLLFSLDEGFEIICRGHECELAIVEFAMYVGSALELHVDRKGNERPCQCQGAQKATTACASERDEDALTWNHVVRSRMMEGQQWVEEITLHQAIKLSVASSRAERWWATWQDSQSAEWYKSFRFQEPVFAA